MSGICLTYPLKSVLSTNAVSYVDQFEPFSEDLKQIVKREPLVSKYIQLIDPKEHLRNMQKFLKKKISLVFKHREPKKESDKHIKKLLKEKRKLEEKLSRDL